MKFFKKGTITMVLKLLLELLDCMEASIRESLSSSDNLLKIKHLGFNNKNLVLNFHDIKF